MNNLDKQYLSILQNIIDNGYYKGDRTGTGSKCIFGAHIRHRMSEGFPLVTTKKMHFRGIAAELIWFLSGSTNIKPLVEQGVNIWNGDAYKKFKNTSHVPYDETQFIEAILSDDNVFTGKYGDLGPIYGKQWRAWNNLIWADEAGEYYNAPIDQINNVINDLRTNPNSRRIIVNAWNVAEIDDMTLPPCHLGYMFDTRPLSQSERMILAKDNLIEFYHQGMNLDECLKLHNVPEYELSLSWNQRSVDVPLGLPYNIASYGLLLLMICKEVNMVPGELIGNLGNTHIYNNQMDGVKEQLTRKGHVLPLLVVDNPSGNLDGKKLLSNYKIKDFSLYGYKHDPHIIFPLSN